MFNIEDQKQTKNKYSVYILLYIDQLFLPPYVISSKNLHRCFYVMFIIQNMDWGNGVENDLNTQRVRREIYRWPKLWFYILESIMQCIEFYLHHLLIYQTLLPRFPLFSGTQKFASILHLTVNRILIALYILTVNFMTCTFLVYIFQQMV